MGTSRVIVHESRLPLPEGSAIRLGKSVYCCSPEQLAVQMAPLLTRIERIFLMGELLGTYAIAPGIEGDMFTRQAPLTNPARVTCHLEQLGHAAGTALVRDALSLACEGSASPAETRLSMRLGLKPALGGYHLDVLSMNEPLQVRRIGEQLGPGVRKPDVLLSSHAAGSAFAGVAFDYNGRVHETQEQFERDLLRQNELLGINFKNYTVSKRLYDSLDYMDDLVRLARRDLGYPEKRHARNERRRRRALRHWLHDELELIDGVHWNGLERVREQREAEGAGEKIEVVELVPLEAYELERWGY